MATDMGEITLHHDTAGNRLHLVLSFSGAIALASAGAMYGAMNTRVGHLEAEVEKRPTTAEIQSLRADVQDIKAGIREINQLLMERAAARKE